MIVAFFQKGRPNFKRRRARLFKKLFTTFYIPNAISKVVKLSFMDIPRGYSRTNKKPSTSVSKN